MKQIFLDRSSGNLEVADVPIPVVKPGYLLIQTRRSLISSGTERWLVDHAKQQANIPNQTLNKIPLGYLNCGVVLEVGAGVEGFAPGDRVASNGSHAEVVCVPKNLCAKVPDNVSDEEAVFTVLSSIGLQGIRLLDPKFGETIVVFGLGLIGLITVQILKACGCRVLGVDLHKNKLVLAEKYGAKVVNIGDGEDIVAAAKAFSNGQGIDGVLITATAKNDTILHDSAQICRKRGRIVLIGTANLNLDRTDFYEKELTFQVSCSYGPGRYDTSYENEGHDYPIGFVRWTEGRNLQIIVESMASKILSVKELVSQRIPLTQAETAYDILLKEPDRMALILTYPNVTQ